MPKPTQFGKRLKEVRDLRDLTQEQLAGRSGVPAAMISHFETGVRPSASADTLVKLANALNVSIDYLLGRSDDPTPRSGRVEAAFRSLADASEETIDTALSVVKTLVERDREKKRRE